MTLKRYRHNPPHLFVDGAYYFITGATLNKQVFLSRDKHKTTLLQAIEKWYSHFDWQIIAWIVLSNHYHIVAKAALAKSMPAIIARVHGASSTSINRLDDIPGRRVWWNYWDTCIRGDSDYELRLAYIYWNAVKHKIVVAPNEYKWSSFTFSKSIPNLPKRFELDDNYDDF